jgi:hypothetical protein
MSGPNAAHVAEKRKGSMTEKQKITDKLAKIKAMAEGAKAIGNEAEAQAFATMLQNLLLKHKLDMTDIEYAQHLKEEPIVEHTMKTAQVKDSRGHYRRVYEEYPDVEVRRRRIEWIESLAAIIAKAHNCEIIVITGSSRLLFIGMQSSVEIVEYLFITMVRAAERLANEAYGIRWHELLNAGQPVQLCRGFKASWLEGFISRLLQRFEEEKKKMESSNTGTALMRINKEVQLVQQYLKRKADRKETAITRSVRGRPAGNEEGYRRGRKAADAMRLDANAIKSGKPNQPLLD